MRTMHASCTYVHMYNVYPLLYAFGAVCSNVRSCTLCVCPNVCMELYPLSVPQCTYGAVSSVCAPLYVLHGAVSSVCELIPVTLSVPYRLCQISLFARSSYLWVYPTLRIAVERLILYSE